MTYQHTSQHLRLLLVLLLLCSIFAGLATPVIAHPSFQPGLTGQIAYVDQGDIYLLDLATGGPRRLTNDGTIGADRSNTAFTGSGTSVESSIAWSPDGALLAFTSNRTGAADIYTLNLESGEITQITSNAVDDFASTFDPDGALVFIQTLVPWAGNGIFAETDHLIVRHARSGSEDVIYEQKGQPCDPSGLSLATLTTYALALNCRSSVDVTLFNNGRESYLGDFVPSPCGAAIGRTYSARNAVWAHRGKVLAFIGANCASLDQENWQDALFLLDLGETTPVARKVYAPNGQELLTLGWGPDDRTLVFAASDGIWFVDTQGGIATLSHLLIF